MNCMNIKTRILLCVLVLQVAGFTAMLVHYNKRATNAVLRFNTTQFSSTLTATANQISATAAQLERTALGLARSGEHFHEQHHRHSEQEVKDDMQRLLLRTLNGFSLASGAGLWYEPGALFPAIADFAPYLTQSDNASTPRIIWAHTHNSNDYHRASWYLQVIPDDWPRSEHPPQLLHWSLQVAGAFPGEEQVMTAATPMFGDEQNLIGVATVNWNLNHITGLLQGLTFTEGTHVSLFYPPCNLFLTDSFGLSAESLQGIKQQDVQILTDEAGNMRLAIAATPGLVIAVQIPHSDLAAVVSNTMASGMAIHAGIAVLFLAVMALVLTILFRPFEQILQRLRNAVSVNRVAERPHFTPLRYEASNEFTPIVETYNTLVAQVADFTGRLSQANALLQDEQRRTQELNATLESKVAARTLELAEKNSELSESLQLLKLTQKQLLTLEKHTALGEVVAGLAHEINTPLGISVTAVSALEDQLHDLEELVRKQQLNKEHFSDYVAFAREGLTIAADNLRRAADLIARFKQVAVDQASEQKRDFELCDYVQSILFSLRPGYKYRPLDVTVDCQQRIFMSSYPGAVAQIITNLLMNALTHAFPAEKDDPQHRGQIVITIREDAGQVTLIFRDNGAGMTEEIRQQLFSPFFTTRREKGGSGLGTSIILDLVTHQLNGSVTVSSQPGAGTEFCLTFPATSV